MNRVSELSQDHQNIALVRAGFIRKGTSLHAWCKASGVDYSNAYKALSGKWTGRKAQELVRQIVEAAEEEDLC